MTNSVSNTGTLQITTPTEREIVMTRVFDAPSVYPSQEVRDMLITSGMNRGAAETYDRLAECLTSIA